MSDLVVDTSALRSVAGTLRSIGDVAAEMHGRGDRLSSLVPGVGAPDPARALSAFLATWSYGLGLTGHQVVVLAGTLESAADAYDAVEARLTAAAAGGEWISNGVPTPGGGSLVAAPSPVPEPPPPPRPEAGATPHWGHLAAGEIQLSSATHPRQLVPGEPDDVTYLGSTLRTFAVAVSDAGVAVRRQSTDGWVGVAATAFAAQVGVLPAAFDAAAAAFGSASAGLLRHAEVLSDAQLQAVVALRRWQDAEAQSQVWRGVLPGVEPVPNSGTDPGAAGMARAAAMLFAARAEVESSGRALAAALDEAVLTAPKDPGVFARLARAIRSFGGGAGEGLEGMATGAAALAVLAVKLNPVNAVVDPEGHLAAIHTLVDGAENAAVNWDDTAKALLDWDTWATDPARATGHLAPDLVIALFTAGAGTVAARGTRAAHHADELAASNKVDDLDEIAGAARLREHEPLPELWDLHHTYGRGTHEWADAVVERYPHLTKDDVLALFEYTDGDYGTVNHFLRDPASFPPEFHAAKAAHLERMSEALGKLPNYEGGLLFRGADLPEDVLATWQPGARVSDPGFLSTTTSEVMGKHFAWERNTFIRIEDSRSGVDIQQLSSHWNEKEVLFDRNTSFDVVSRTWDTANNRWDITLREAAP